MENLIKGRTATARGMACAVAFLVAVPLVGTHVAGAVATASTSTVAANKFRTVTNFGPGWLFNYGDASN